MQLVFSLVDDIEIRMHHLPSPIKSHFAAQGHFLILFKYFGKKIRLVKPYSIHESGFVIDGNNQTAAWAGNQFHLHHLPDNGGVLVFTHLIYPGNCASIQITPWDVVQQVLNRGYSIFFQLFGTGLTHTFNKLYINIINGFSGVCH